VAYDQMVPEVWAAALLKALRKKLVFAQGGVINRNWEGEIKKQGDTVRINSVGRPTVRKFTGAPLTREKLDSAQRVLQITEADYFDFEVDDINQVQANAAILSETMDEAAYAMVDQVDRFIASLYTQAQTANQLGTISVPVGTPTNFYDKVLVPLQGRAGQGQRSDRGPVRDRAAVGSKAALLLDSRFIKANEAGTDRGPAQRSWSFRAAGFDLMRVRTTRRTRPGRVGRAGGHERGAHVRGADQQDRAVPAARHVRRRDQGSAACTARS
jgi:hypothetical protein